MGPPQDPMPDSTVDYLPGPPPVVEPEDDPISGLPDIEIGIENLNETADLLLLDLLSSDGVESKNVTKPTTKVPEIDGLTLFEIGILLGGGTVPLSKGNQNVFYANWSQLGSARRFGYTGLRANAPIPSLNAPTKKRGGFASSSRINDPVDTTLLATLPGVYIQIVKLDNGLFVAYIGQSGGKDVQRPAIVRIVEALHENLAPAPKRNINDLIQKICYRNYSNILLQGKFKNWKLVYALCMIRDKLTSAQAILDNYKSYEQMEQADSSKPYMLREEKQAVQEFLDLGTFFGKAISFITGPVILVNDDPMESLGFSPITPEFFFTLVNATSQQISALTNADIQGLYQGTLPPSFTPWQKPPNMQPVTQIIQNYLQEN